jgi:hypothetical protein
MTEDEKRAAAEAHYGEPVTALTKGDLTLWVPTALLEQVRARKAEREVPT